MTVPTVPGRFLYTGAWTIGTAAAALVRGVVTRDHGAVARMTPGWSRRMAAAWGMEVQARGRENVDPDETYVFMANHQSHVDIVAILEALPVVPGFLAKKELKKIPFFGRAMEVGGHVFIDRTHRDRAFEAIAEAAAQVSAGASIVVFPEGTRADRPGVKAFKKGGFHLAKQARVSIVPVGIRGSGSVLPKHSKSIRPGKVEVHIGEPLDAARVVELSLEDLIAEVRARILELSGLPDLLAGPGSR